MERVSELISEVPDFKTHLEIKLIGSVSQEARNDFTIWIGFI
jgi:hypothetical protein